MTMMMHPLLLSFSRLYRVWLNHSLTATRWVLDSASSGLSGSSMTMKSAPLPVSTPPTEVASRNPFSVVTNSCADCFWGDSLVGNKLLYHSLDIKLRQSSECLYANSSP